ncbi:hypothetical protein [Pseudonocardia sp. T1-2H]|uniref:hypothetical protein n=1 Tax=Pseudonocardia sp. T1-2H TaxID=3128899 RepID=UPI003100BBDF
MTATAGTQTRAGRVAQVAGPVVDVELPRNSVPELYNALTLDVSFGELARTLTLEIAQHREITGELWGIHRQAPSFDKSSPASSNTEVPYP